jgi:DNA-directed RNA polymerase specialized sigma24 family protein
MAQDPTASLRHLADVARCLREALAAYQHALLGARQAGATHTQIAEVLGISESGARWRCKAAIDGGEIHLRLEPTQETGSEEQ